MSPVGVEGSPGEDAEAMLYKIQKTAIDTTAWAKGYSKAAGDCKVGGRSQKNKVSYDM